MIGSLEVGFGMPGMAHFMRNIGMIVVVEADEQFEPILALLIVRNRSNCSSILHFTGFKSVAFEFG